MFQGPSPRLGSLPGNEVILKLCLEVLPILELPFVWEMNSKLIKRERESEQEREIRW